MTDPVRVLIADDNQIVRLGLVALLGTDPTVEVCGEAADGRAAADLAAEERPDVVLLDVRMPGSDGLSVLPELVAITRVLMLTHSDEPDVIARALAAGATGYLVHGAFDRDELVHAVQDAAAGRMRLSPGAAAVLTRVALGEAAAATPDDPATAPSAPAGAAPRAAPATALHPTSHWDRVVAEHRLSPREVEVCRELVKGSPNRVIASTLYIEPKTVKNHLNNVFAKLGVASRAQALAVLLGSVGDTGHGPVPGVGHGSGPSDGPGRLGPGAQTTVP